MSQPNGAVPSRTPAGSEDLQSYWCEPCRDVTDWEKREGMYHCTGRDGKCTNTSRMIVDVEMKKNSWKGSETQAEIKRRKVREYMRKKRGTRRPRV